MGKFSIFVVGLMTLAGCSQAVDHKGKTPLVEVGHEFLYKEDLQAAMPVGMRGQDSARFAEEYIHNWIKDVLLYKKAEGNIPDNVKVDELVASYRKALIMHTDQEELVNQKLGNEISDAEIEQYYNQNTGMFSANQPYVQGLFMKVPISAQHLNNVRAWYKKNTQDAIDKLEKFGVIEKHLGDDIIRSRIDFLFQVLDVTGLVGCLVMFFRVSGNPDAEVCGDSIC